jgi:hypothetical protein
MFEPMTKFKKEDWQAIEMEERYQAIIRDINDTRDALSNKVDEVLLNQELMINVNSILEKKYPDLQDNIKFSVIKFIKDNYYLQVARQVNYLTYIVDVACAYITNQNVPLATLLSVYSFLRKDCAVDILSDKYSEYRTTLIFNPETVNYIFGTRIEDYEADDKVYAIHKRIIDKPIEEIKEKVEKALERAKKSRKYKDETIKSVAIAIVNIKFMDNLDQEINELMSKIDHSLYVFSRDDELDMLIDYYGSTFTLK